MAVQFIGLQDFRNIQFSSLYLSSSLNFFVGANGAGKTALLESVFLALVGRSFRSNSLSEVITLDKDSSEVSLKLDQLPIDDDVDLKGENRFDNVRVSLRRTGPTNKRKVISLNETPINSVSAHARRCPVYYFSPTSLDLFYGEPSARRNFIDWLLFHVEPSYAGLFNRYKFCLKSRNSLLKSFLKGEEFDSNQLDYWSTYLLETGQKLEGVRQANLKILFEEFGSQLDDCINQHRFLDKQFKISLSYEDGWGSSGCSRESLETSLGRDRALGVTNIGSQKSDLRLITNDQSLKNLLSRGQLKLLTLIMVKAACSLIQSKLKKQTILLIDDLFAELDSLNVELASSIISGGVEQQCLVTSTQFPDAVMMNPIISKSQKVFHVEQGSIKEEN